MNVSVRSALVRPMRIYYGWWVLCATAVTEMLAMGSTAYAAGLFVLPLESDLHLSRTAASSAIPILFAGAALVAPLVGYVLDRLSVQWVMSAGALLSSAAFVLIAATASPLVMALALFVPAAIGFVAIGPLTTSTLVSRWFYRRRGRAFGIAAVATSGGGILVVPVLSAAITSFGWRNALIGEAACIAAAVCVLAAAVVRGGPSELNLERDPENAGRPAAELSRRSVANAANHGTDWTIGRIFRNRNFWGIAIPLAAISGIDQSIVVTAVPYGTGLGFTQAAAAFLIPGFSVSAALTKVASGVLADFLDRRLIMIASTAFMLAASLILVGSTAYIAVFAACCLCGVALGCVLPSSSALTAACFGSPSFGTVMGWMYGAAGLSAIVLVEFAAAVFDRSGNYRIAFLTFIALSLAAALMALLVRPHGGDRRAAP